MNNAEKVKKKEVLLTISHNIIPNNNQKKYLRRILELKVVFFPLNVQMNYETYWQHAVAM